MGQQWLGGDEHDRLHRENIPHTHVNEGNKAFDFTLTLAAVLVIAATVFIIIYLLNTGSK